MRPAAVGFQCPACVNEGRRSTRAGLTPYGGRRTGNPQLTSQLLIVVNLAVWALILATGGHHSPWLYRLGLLPTTVRAPVGDGVTAVFTGVSDGAYWQLVTSMFTHVEIWHIGFNMVALWVLGPQLESVLGRTRFLVVYFLSGLTGSALVYWLAPVNGITIGASGALFGLMGALLVIAVKVRANVGQIAMWIGLNFVFTVLGRGFISWEGHLGGFVGGVVVALAFVLPPRRQRTAWQVAGAGVLAVLLALAVVSRTAELLGPQWG